MLYGENTASEKPAAAEAIANHIPRHAVLQANADNKPAEQAVWVCSTVEPEQELGPLMGMTSSYCRHIRPMFQRKCWMSADRALPLKFAAPCGSSV